MPNMLRACMLIRGADHVAPPEGALWKSVASSDPPENGSSSSSVLERADGELGPSASLSAPLARSFASASASMSHVSRSSFSADHHELTCDPKGGQHGVSRGRSSGREQP